MSQKTLEEKYLSQLQNKATLIRKWCLISTTEAASGHPTSCLSAADIATVLFGKYFSFDVQNPQNPNNDRFFLSKGHASPLLYTLFAMSGGLKLEELKTLRKVTSRLEGHPTLEFPFAEVVTGSLGQGLSIGAGNAVVAKKNNAGFKTFVLMGDGELAEGSVWEAANFASYYKLNNLIAIADINRLGQSQETMFGHSIEEYVNRFSAFGWEVFQIDGHNFEEIEQSFDKALYKNWYISYLMGAQKISDKDLAVLGIKVIKTVANGNRKIKIPKASIEQYFDLLTQKMENHFWNEALGSEILLLFKHADGKVERLTLSQDTAPKIYQYMHEFNNLVAPKVSDYYEAVVKDWINGSGAEGFYADYFKPKIIIAKTFKGKGISFLENKDGWHGKALKKEDLEKALKELGDVDDNLRFVLKQPNDVILEGVKRPIESRVDPIASLQDDKYKLGEEIATREVYGEVLAELGKQNELIYALDAEVKNSTYSMDFQKVFPERFIECFIAEQNMVGVATGLSTRGKIPFVSTFAAFLTRAFDQIRMGAISQANIKFVGSHVGVSIGEDGASQMGLEDIAMFGVLPNSVVLHPSDAVSTAKLLPLLVKHKGISYLRTLRPKTPVIYNQDEEFTIGGSKILRQSKNDVLTIVAAGITVFEALIAYEELKKAGINVRVVDCYSVKPIDKKTLKLCVSETLQPIVITVEDHFKHGGLGDFVLSALSDSEVRVYKMAVTEFSHSGLKDELLDRAGISATHIIDKVKLYR